jgi:hypothetical protein
LIAAVAAANPHTIVVLQTGGPVTMPWLDAVPAVVEAWYSGNGGAAAIARVLFGEVNPSGRLPLTFPLAESQLPHPIITGQRPDGRIVPTTGTPTAYDVIYQEGARVGYRWFEDQKLTPLFPFGFGLSYTSFSYENLKVVGAATIKAEFDVKNTGTLAGKTVAQVYVKPPFGPTRLVGFQKVELAPGESKHVTLYADPRLIAMFDADANLWRVADGDYVGAPRGLRHRQSRGGDGACQRRDGEAVRSRAYQSCFETLTAFAPQHEDEWASRRIVCVLRDAPSFAPQHEEVFRRMGGDPRHHVFPVVGAVAGRAAACDSPWDRHALP